MSEPKLILLRPQDVEGVWGKIASLIARACERSMGRYHASHVKRYALSGFWQLWLVVEDGKVVFVGGTHINTYDTGIKEFDIRFASGKGIDRWQHLLPEALNWAKAQGCSIAHALGRRGFSKIPAFQGWKHSHDSLETAI